MFITINGRLYNAQYFTEIFTKDATANSKYYIILKSLNGEVTLTYSTSGARTTDFTKIITGLSKVDITATSENFNAIYN